MKETKIINKPQAKKTKASDVIILAIFAFLSLQIVPILNYVIVWTPLIDTVKLDDRLWTVILHLISEAVWVGLGFWLVHLSRTECGFNIEFKAKAPSAVKLIIAAAISVVFTACMLIFAGGFSIPYEIKGAVDLICTVEYYIFLIVNAAVFVAVMVFGQKFGDVLWRESNIPWGGIVLGVGMAISNLIGGFSNMTEGDSVWMVLLSAAVVFVYAAIYGVIFVLAEKKPLYALPFVALIFALL